MIKTINFIAIIKDDIKVDKTHIFDPSDPTRPHSNISDTAAVEGLKLVYMHKSRDHTMYIVWGEAFLVKMNFWLLWTQMTLNRNLSQ